MKRIVLLFAFLYAGMGPAQEPQFNGRASVNQPGSAITGTVPVANGGTGASTGLAAAANLSTPYVVMQSGVAVSVAADTNENATDTITLPAMGANSTVRVKFAFAYTSSTNAKTVRVRLGGIGGSVLFTGASVNSTSGQYDEMILQNRNATNSQGASVMAAHTNSGGTLTGVSQTSAIETNAGTTLVVTCQKATAGEACTRERITVEYLHGP